MSNDSETKSIADISEHLKGQAGNYFPELGGSEVMVTLLSERRRTNSALYRFELAGHGVRRNVLVKIPSLRGGVLRDKRPYFLPETDQLIKYRVQYAAMIALHARFGNLTDPRFGAVRPFELLPDYDAFVMEEIAGKTIKQLLRKSNRLQSPLGIGELRGVFENTGAWLREFHALPVDPNTEVIHSNSVDLVDRIEKLTGFLERAINDENFFRPLAERAGEVARNTLKDPLPLGVRFGDFGLTNVLVSTDNRITGIDTQAIWYTPIYEDIGYFLTGLKTYRPQVLSLGLAFGTDRIGMLESAFLEGYFQTDPIPLREIRVYEIARLLERWSAKSVRAHSQQGVGAKFGTAILNHFMRRTILSLLKEASKL
ncbi:MAG: phosphotransferase [Methylococcales bacterium]